MASSSVSDLRIVLLGKNVPENNQVENLIQGSPAFDREAPYYSQQPSERNISVINTQLLQAHVSHHQITQRVKECVSLSAPGPHVILLVLQYNDFSEEDRNRVKTVLKLFSEKAIKHTIVVTTDEVPLTSKLTSKLWDNAIHNLIKDCGGRHLPFDTRNTGWRSEMFRRIEKILKEEHEEFLICNIYEDGGGGTSVDEDPENSDSRGGGQFYQSTKTGSDGGVITSGKTKLNIVLCGYNTTLKNSLSKIFRGITSKTQKEMSKVCVKKEGTTHGHQITVIELPALTRLSEEEVMRETLNCLILGDPGVHLFILVTPVTPLTNEDKEEMEKIKRIFNSNEHFMVLFTSELTVDQSVSDFVLSTESQKVVSLYGSWYCVMGFKDHRNYGGILKILNGIDNIKIEPYSLQTYMRAQENRVRHELEEKLRARENEIKNLQEKIKTPEGVKLNLVLCGNARLKSFISSLILNQSERGSQLGSECMRRQVEIHGHLINLLELPALTRLSEEEVMRQTLRCVSLCDPGVHVFLLIIPATPLNNEDRAEMEKFQKIFSSSINKHIMILIMQNPENQTAALSEEKQSVIKRFGGRHHFFGPTTRVSLLVDKLKQMVEENREEFFSTETFLEAQMKKLLEFEEIKKRIYPQDLKESADDLRIVLLGKTGVGKSSTANTILGREVFKAELSQDSITKVCKKETIKINGRRVTVIDTPGLFDTKLTNEEIQREISNCISMILPGPHVFLLLISLGRFTQEEAKSVKLIQETFGENSSMYTIVLFTRGDDLDNKTIEQYLENPGSPLMNLIEACGNRYHVFNNKKTLEDRTQVSDLLKKIDIMVKENGDSYYSCKMFREMEREIQEQQKKMLLMKHEEEKEKMKTIMMQEKKNHERERKRREEEFRAREEQYRRDIKERVEQERKIREEWERQKQQERQRRDEEDEKRREKEQAMWDKCNQRLEQERERRLREREDLQLKYEEEKGKNKIMIEEQKQNRDKDRKRREDEFREREEQYKRDIKDIEDQERKIREEMKREREEWERQKQEEKQREEEEKETRKSNELKRTPEDQLTNNDEDSPSDPGCLRILLFGRRGNGKSATGNTILRKNKFHSEESSDPVTTLCKKEVGEVDGKSVAVVDTPGLFDSSLENKQLVEEMMNCVSLSAPGPHVFIIVLSLREISQEERDTLDMIKMIFGSKAAEFSIVLFTRADELKKQTIEQYVEKSKNDELKKLISDCGNRFLAFNNRETQDQKQVTELLKMIEELKKSNERRYFTNEMFEEAAISIEKRRKMIEENKRKNQAQVEELEAKYDMEFKNMIERLQKKKKKTDEERVKVENKFRETEETLKSDFEKKEKSEQKKREDEEQKGSEEQKQQRDEYDQRIDEIEREIENQNEKQEKEREEREEQDRKREEKYRQDQEKMKTEQERIMAELRKKQEEEIKKRDSEEEMRKKQEEKEREEWKRKIKEAEDDEEIKRQQREWEEEKNRQMREREEEEGKKQERREEQLKEKQEELENMRERFEQEREEERQKTEDERQKQIREREEREREYEDKRNEMKKHKQLERERKEDWERRKQEDEERRREKRKRWEKMMKDLKQDQEEEIKRREREEREGIEREEKECNEIKKKHEEEIKEMKKKYQDEARKQREELNDFEERKNKHIEEFKGRLEEELNKVKKLREELKDKWSCHVM